MTDVTGRFRWGPSVQAILFHFLTREIGELRRHCKKLIDDFRSDESGEGYRCTIITFEMFEYGFVLAYSYTTETWILEAVYFPNFGAPDCRRKPPRRRGNPRVIEKIETKRRPSSAWLGDNLNVLYKITADQIGRKLTLFWADASTILSSHNILGSLQQTRMRYIPQYEVLLVIERFTVFAEQQSRGCDNVVQLVRAKVNEAVSFLGPLSSFALPDLRRVKQELWDTELFGALPEHATSG